MTAVPRLILGGLHSDPRGEVRHVNNFHFTQVERFYSIHPANPGDVRGWVGHRHEWKWFCVLHGGIEIGVVQPDDWTAPARKLAIHRFMLRANKPAVLEVPAGFFTASVAEEHDSILLIFSSGRIDSARDDEFRLPADYWTF